MNDSVEHSPVSTPHPPVSIHEDDSTVPSTPRRGRYPHGQGRPSQLKDGARVPLHRRGTSNTYERLEDLLREAGYAETRIVTPQSHSKGFPRAPPSPHHPQAQPKGIMRFLSGLVLGTAEEREVEAKDDVEGLAKQAPAPPPHGARMGSKQVLPSQQGLVRRTSSRRPQRAEDAYTPPTRIHDSPSTLSLSRSDSESSFVTSPPRLHGPGRQRPQDHDDALEGTASKLGSKRRSSASLHAYDRDLQKLPHPRVFPASSNRKTTQRSGASNYLRRMASAPAVRREQTRPIRPPSRASTFQVPVARADQEQIPPMPRGWLEAVARAVLGGDGSAGGPTSRNAGTSSLAERTNHPSRSKSKRSASHLAPLPSLLLQPPRSTQGQCGVCTTQVVCRSAPGSRSGSLRRTKRGAKGKGADKGKAVPVLAKTSVEGDVWSSGSGADARPDDVLVNVVDDDDDDDDDDEDCAELDLARILVPAKRQHSIQSLRRHLDDERVRTVRGRASAAALRPPPPKGPSARATSSHEHLRTGAHGTDENDNEDIQQALKNGSWKSVGSGSGYGTPLDGGSRTARSTKRRRAIPSAWQWGGTPPSLQN